LGAQLFEVRYPIVPAPHSFSINRGGLGLQ
jgi:hypothetical protein